MERCVIVNRRKCRMTGDGRAVGWCCGTQLMRLLFRLKFGARIADLESQLEAAKAKAARLEKDKSKLSIEIEEIMVNLDGVSNYCFSSRVFVHICFVTLSSLCKFSTHTAVCGSLRICDLRLWPAADDEPCCRYVPTDEIWMRMTTTSRSWRGHSQVQRPQHSRNVLLQLKLANF